MVLNHEGTKNTKGVRRAVEKTGRIASVFFSFLFVTFVSSWFNSRE